MKLQRRDFLASSLGVALLHSPMHSSIPQQSAPSGLPVGGAEERLGLQPSSEASCHQPALLRPSTALALLLVSR